MQPVPAIISTVAETTDTSLVKDHIIPSQYLANWEERNLPNYDPDYQHRGKIFLEVFGDVRVVRASINFICSAILQKITETATRLKFENVFDKLRTIANDATRYEFAPSGKALGKYTDATYTGKDAYLCSIPLTHCVWFSAEHKYHKTDPAEKLADASVRHLLALLKTRIERAIAVIYAACRNNRMRCVLDVEIYQTLNDVNRELQQLITAS